VRRLVPIRGGLWQWRDVVDWCRCHDWAVFYEIVVTAGGGRRAAERQSGDCDGEGAAGVCLRSGARPRGTATRRILCREQQTAAARLLIPYYSPSAWRPLHLTGFRCVRLWGCPPITCPETRAQAATHMSAAPSDLFNTPIQLDWTHDDAAPN
jgi:hypothetical protein